MEVMVLEVMSFGGCGLGRFECSPWVPPKGRDPWLDLYLEEVSSSIIRGLKKKGRSNISRSESEALLSLMRDDSIVIRPADKGSSFVILDKENYVSRLSEEVEKGECYGKTPGDITSSVIRKVSWLRDWRKTGTSVSARGHT